MSSFLGLDITNPFHFYSPLYVINRTVLKFKFGGICFAFHYRKELVMHASSSIPQCVVWKYKGKRVTSKWYHSMQQQFYVAILCYRGNNEICFLISFFCLTRQLHAQLVESEDGKIDSSVTPTENVFTRYMTKTVSSFDKVPTLCSG